MFIKQFVVIVYENQLALIRVTFSTCTQTTRQCVFLNSLTFEMLPYKIIIFNFFEPEIKQSFTSFVQYKVPLQWITIHSLSHLMDSVRIEITYRHDWRKTYKCYFGLWHSFRTFRYFVANSIKSWIYIEYLWGLTKIHSKRFRRFENS